nr:hypothetical protein [Pyxidicoccus fallax]
MRRLWIALIAGLSLGQTSDVTPPEDPSTRDPAAEALEEAYEEAARTAEGSRPPPGYIVQQPLDQGASPTIVGPALPDGSAPVPSGQVAQEEASQVYQPVPSPPMEALDGEDAAMGGSGSPTPAETAPGPESQTPPPGVPSGPTGTQPGSAGGGTAPPTPGAQPGAATGTTGQEATGGAGTAGTPAPAGQDASGGTGATGTAPGTGAGSTPGDTGAPGTAPSTGTGGAGTTGTAGTGGGASAAGAAQPSPTQQELAQLRERVQQLETELRERDETLDRNNQAVQQQLDTFGQRSVDVERARQRRLAQIQTAGQWMLAADQALESGELDVGNALSLADRAFADVRASAAQYGQGSVVVHAERARALINNALEAADNRDIYGARRALQDAGYELSAAREASLQREGTGNVLLNP